MTLYSKWKVTYGTFATKKIIKTNFITRQAQLMFGEITLAYILVERCSVLWLHINQTFQTDAPLKKKDKMLPDHWPTPFRSISRSRPILPSQTRAPREVSKESKEAEDAFRDQGTIGVLEGVEEARRSSEAFPSRNRRRPTIPSRLKAQSKKS